jgi:glycosyltransferase involved in cell wall biosynthesis
MEEILALRNRLARKRFDLVHVQTPFVAHYAGLQLARHMNIPCVETYHTLFEEYFHHYLRRVPRSWLRGLTRRFSRWQCNTLDGLVVPSRPMQERLEQYGVHARTAVIPTGIELDDFKTGNGDSFRSHHGIPPGRPMLLFVGRVAHEKNIGFLLEVLDEVRKSIPGILLVIAGEGPARKALSEQALALNLHNNLKFIGYLDRRTTLRDCYKAADLFVFASSTETQGLVLLEALAAGLPVVSTAEMGTRDVLVHRRGCLVAPEDVREFSDQVLRAIKDADLHAMLRKTGPEYAAEWSASAQAARLEGFYETTLAAFGASRQAGGLLQPEGSPLPGR